MATKNIRFDLRFSIDELQDELDEEYLLAGKILLSYDPNICKLEALLSEINQIYCS